MKEQSIGINTNESVWENLDNAMNQKLKINLL